MLALIIPGVGGDGILLTSIDDVGMATTGVTSIDVPFNAAKASDNIITVNAVVWGITSSSMIGSSMTCVCKYTDHGVDKEIDAGFAPVGLLTANGVSFNDSSSTVVPVTTTITLPLDITMYTLVGKITIGAPKYANDSSPNSGSVLAASEFANAPDITITTDTTWGDLNITPTVLPADVAGLSIKITDGATLTLSGTNNTFAPNAFYLDNGMLQGATNGASETIIVNGGQDGATTSGNVFSLGGTGSLPPQTNFAHGLGVTPDGEGDPSYTETLSGDNSGLTNLHVRDDASVLTTTLPDAIVGLNDSGQITFSDADPSVATLNGDVDSVVTGSGTLTINGASGGYGNFCGDICDGTSSLSVVINGTQVLLGTQSYTGSTTVNGTLGISGNVTNLAIGDGGTIQTVADTTLSSAFAIPDDPAAIATIDTNGFTVTVSATVTGGGQLRVTGGGTLNLTGSIAASTLIVDGGATAVVNDPASVPDGVSLSVGDTDALASLDDSLLLTRLTTTEGEDAPPPFDYARAHAIYEGRREVSVDVLMAEAAVFNPTNPDTTAAVMSAIGVDFSAAVAMLAANGGTRDGLTQAAVDSAMAGAWAAAGKTAVSNSNTWDGGVANPYDDQVISWRNLELEFMETHSVS